MSRVYVLGLCGMGFLMSVPRLPVPGETIQAQHMTTEPGGKGANQAVALARLGNEVEFVTALGRDSSGDVCLDFLAHEHVKTRYCIRVETPTTVGVVATERRNPASVEAGPVSAAPGDRSDTTCNKDNMVIVYPGSATALHAEHVLVSAPALDWADAVLLQLEVPLEANLTAAREAARRGKPVFINPAPAPESYQLADSRLRELLSLATLITPNAVEAQQLLGLRPATDVSISKAAELVASLAAFGPRQVVVTLGAQGAVAYDAGRIEHVPAHPVRVVDTTGAGDSFTAALVSEILAGDSRTLLDAVHYAIRAAEICVGRPGVMASFPTATEVAIARGHLQ
ncbi:MAG: ribokinase [Bacteroidota bacterium]